MNQNAEMLRKTFQGLERTMKYTGRVVIMVILFFNLIIWRIYENMNHNLFTAYVIGAIVYLSLCWWLGLQYDRAKFYSEKDALTEIHNRRFVQKMFSKLCSLADRNNKNLGLLVLDINDFKVINDKYGHDRGDLVLQQISNLLIEFTRKSDVVARWGGDEFLIIVSFIDKSGIEFLIQRIQAGLNKLSEKIQTDITVSVGSAIYPHDAFKLDDLIQIADRNMYLEKSQKES